MLRKQNLSKTYDEIHLDKKPFNILTKNNINDEINFLGMENQTKDNKSEILNVGNLRLDNISEINKINEFRNNDNSDKKKQFNFVKTIKIILKGKVFSLMIILAILILLFLEDIKILAINYHYDKIIDSIIFFFYLFVIFEFIVFNIFFKNYRFSLFFWLDIISIITLIPEIHLFNHHEEYVYDNQSKNKLKIFFASSSHYTKAARAAVAGSKAGRIFRYMKIFNSSKNDDKMDNDINVLDMRREKFFELKEIEDLHHNMKRETQEFNENKSFKSEKSELIKIKKSATNFQKKIDLDDDIKINNEKKIDLNPKKSNLLIVYENKFENEPSIFSKQNVENNRIFSEKIKESNEKNKVILNRLMVNKNQTFINNQKLLKKITKFYGEDYDENFLKNNSLKITPKLLISHSSNKNNPIPRKSESNVLLSDSDINNIIKNEVKNLKYKNNFQYIRENNLNQEDVKNIFTSSSHIKLKSMKIKGSKCKSFSFFERKKNNEFLLKNQDYSIFSDEDIQMNKEINKTLVTYMHYAFETNEKPIRKKESVVYRRSNSINSSILKNDEKSKYHPNLGLWISKQTTIKVIFIILSLVYIEPFLNFKNYISPSNNYPFTATILNNYLERNMTFEFKSFIDVYIKNESSRATHFPNLLKLGFVDLDKCEQFENNCKNETNSQGYYFKNSYFLQVRPEERIALNDTTFIFIVYRKDIMLEAILNILKILSIAFILWMGAFIFLRDSDRIVVRDLEKISEKIENFQFNIDKYFYKSKIEKSHKNEKSPKNNEDLTLIYHFIKSYSILLIKLYGLRSYLIFRNKLDIYKRKWPLQKSYTRINSTILVIKFGIWNEVVDKYCEEASSIFSHILEIIDLTLIEHFGELIFFDNNEIVAMWDNDIYQRKIENHSINKSKMSSEHEDSLRELYESFDVTPLKNNTHDEKSLYSKDIYLDRLNSKDHLPNDISNFIMICILKLLSRLNYNPYLITKLRNINCNNLKVHMSLDRGNIFQMVSSSLYKREARHLGINVSRAISINQYSSKYGLSIVMTEKFAKHLDDEFLAYTREIYSIKEDKAICNIFSFETDFHKEAQYENYYNRIKITKETSILMRNEFVRMIINKSLCCVDLLLKDVEVMFSINKNLNFLKNYRYAYYLIKTNNSIPKAKKMLKKALQYNSNDIKTQELLNE